MRWRHGSAPSATTAATARYQHPELGLQFPSRTLQAVVLSAKLARLATWNKARAAAAERYSELLAGLPRHHAAATMPGNTHVWHLYVVRFAGGAAQRDAVLSALHASGVGAGIHYPFPVHLQGAFAGLGHGPGDFPVAEAAAASMLSLPLFPHISDEQIDHVVGVVTAAGLLMTPTQGCSSTPRASARATTWGRARGSGPSPTCCRGR